MPVSKNSGSSRRSKPRGARPGSGSSQLWPLLAVLAFLSLMALGAVLFVQAREHALYYGDAAAHLNIARRLFDGRTPGYHQIGTVWLPLPHLIFLPFVRVEEWWRNGLAGAIPSALCWITAGTILFLTLRRYFSLAASWVGLALFAANPNLLYLAATPMTETIFFAAALGMLWGSVIATEQDSALGALLAGFCGLAATLTRYEGWFLLPFVALYLLVAGGARRWGLCLVFCLTAGLGPLYWLAHNWIFYSDPLEFYRGPDSAQAIYQRYLRHGMARYPGDGDWWKAARQFAYATKALNGWPLLGIAALGFIPALRARCFWPVLFLTLSPVFYVMSLHSGGTPIFIPEIAPFSHYNTRYALAALPLFALLGAALAESWRWMRWLAVPLAAGWFFFYPVLTWRESEVNSAARREWTHELATLLRKDYEPGTGILMPFGDLTAALTEAGIPIRESLHQGDLVYYEAAIARPDLFLKTEWAVTSSGDAGSSDASLAAASALTRAAAMGMPYRLVKRISLKNAPVVEVWRRESKRKQ